MDFKFEEKIEISFTIEEIEQIITEMLQEKGFASIKINLDYEEKWVNVGEYPYGSSEKVRSLKGFKVQAKRI